jgi:hypothetical protein
MDTEKYIKTLQEEIGTKRSKRYYQNRIWDIDRLTKIAKEFIGIEALESNIITPLYELNQKIEERLENSQNALKYLESLDLKKAMEYSKKVKAILEKKKQILESNKEINPDYFLDSTYEEDFLMAYYEARSENKEVIPKQIKDLEKFLKNETSL